MKKAIEIANDTDYGLSGAVFTGNLGRGLKIAKEIDSGAIHINSMTVQYVQSFLKLRMVDVY